MRAVFWTQKARYIETVLAQCAELGEPSAKVPPPDNALLLVTRAAILLQPEQPDNATKALQLALNYEPENQQAHMMLASLGFPKGKDD